MKRDLRTTEGRKQEILECIREDGGFTIFWITATYLRAYVADTMRSNGEIETTPTEYPNIKARILND